jgi:hypothetical protein
MQRRVEPELLDTLPPDDRRAIRSRKDLHRINAFMGNTQIIAKELRGMFNGTSPKNIVDIGAGDGLLMLGVAKEIARKWNGPTVRFVDRQSIVSQQTLAALETLGWRAAVSQADILDWFEQPSGEQVDVMIANLFLHHFTDGQLSKLLARISERVRAFIAVEPRRWGWALFFSRLVGLIGCSSVTRHDALASVRAGFAGQELSKLWPAVGGWSLEERPANWCSHLFIAKRTR